MSNQTTITTFLRSKGLTNAQIAGVEGNLKIESGFSPTSYNPGEKAIGIAQWEGPRRTALQAYARKAGTSETNLATQLGFLWHELTTSESGALAALRATSTPSAAAAAFDSRYERSSGEARSQRQSAATVIARALGGGAVDTSVGGLTPKAKPKAPKGGTAAGTAPDTTTDAGGGGDDTTGASAQTVGFNVGGVFDWVPSLLSGARNIALEGVGVVLAAALVGGGLYKLFGPQIKAAGGAATKAATVAVAPEAAAAT